MKQKTALLVLLAIMFATGIAHRAVALSPATLNYQGRLTNASDVAQNGVFSIQFNLWSESVGGFNYWTETQAVTVTNGLFSATLGLSVPIPSTTFGDTTLYLGIKVGADPELTPRTLLTASSFSHQVRTIDGALGGNVNGSSQISGDLFVNATTTTALLAQTNFFSISATGVYGQYSGVGNADATGVRGYSAPADNFGIGGSFEGGYIGATGSVTGTGIGGAYYGLQGLASTTGINPNTTYGVFGQATTGGAGTTYGVYGTASGGLSSFAGYFNGPVSVTGFLSKLGGGFRIDHPKDPANMYLQHSFVESPDMKNFYDGTILLDGRGEATVKLPDWFDDINKDFRYQLTAIGSPAPGLYIARKIESNQFVIAGGTPNQEISWAVTGIRKDVWAEENRMPVELKKPAPEMGKYLYPKGFGRSEAEQIGAVSDDVKAKNAAIRQASEELRASTRK